jgi:hypothetical protein
VSGAGNAFLGGLSAGLYLANGDVREGKEATMVYPHVLIVQSTQLCFTQQYLLGALYSRLVSLTLNTQL